MYKANEAPRFIRGHAVTLAMVGYATVLYALMSVSVTPPKPLSVNQIRLIVVSRMQWYFIRKNAQRRAGKEDHKVEGLSEEEMAELGDESPRFMYTP